jgi:hypothetical protein
MAPNNPKDSENVINKSRSSESVRPILLKDENVFGAVKPEKSKWLNCGNI